jgi:hypothetical protein
LLKDADRHLRDASLYEKYLRLEAFFATDKDYLREGDFSERLKSLTTRLIERYRNSFGRNSETKLSGEEIFGISEEGSLPLYIFDAGYDLKKMRAIISKSAAAKCYLHPALHPALSIRW